MRRAGRGGWPLIPLSAPRWLDDLEGVGLIERRPDPADRRARLITVTTPGCDLLSDLDRRLRIG